MIARAATIWAVLAIAAGIASAGPTGQVAPAAPTPATTAPQAAPATPADLVRLLPKTESPQGMVDTVKWVVLVTVLSLAPAILVMITSFTRIIVVLSLLRQAIAAQNVPPNQVLFGLALLMTVTVMAPVWQSVYSDSISPYLAGDIDPFRFEVLQ